MEEKDKDHIRKNYTKLGDAISDDAINLTYKLFEQGTISKRNKEGIVEISDTNYRKGLKLLDLLTTKGKTAYKDLYNAVRGLEIFVAADILMPANAPHSKPGANDDNRDSSEESLPDNWPSIDEYDISAIVRMIEPKDTKMTALFHETKTPKGQELTYLMSAKPRGRVLTINNELFTHLQEREGTIEDRKAIDTVFQKFNFTVCTVKNKTTQQMWDVLEEESKREDHLKANCFLLFILSHGHNGVVFGTDGHMKNGKPVNCIEVKKIVDIFCSAKSLRGKPKLFFIQACQGGTRDYGYPVGSDSIEGNVPLDASPKKENSTLDTKGDEVDNTFNPEHQTNVKTINDDNVPEAHSDETLVKTLGDGVPEAQSDHANVPAILDNILTTTVPDSHGDKRPSGADVLIAMATLPGYLSWRNTVKGSWFVQAIAYVFAKYAYKHDLTKLMTRVSNLVSRAETEGGVKQQGITKSTLSKDFYFFPGLTENE